MQIAFFLPKLIIFGWTLKQKGVQSNVFGHPANSMFFMYKLYLLLKRFSHVVDRITEVVH